MFENAPNSLIIKLLDVSKRYRLEWIFRGIDHEFAPNTRTAILGSNGSGKSTLMRVLSGHLTPSRGKILFIEKNTALENDQIWKKISFAAPYIELVEEFTLLEALEFHGKLKPFLPTFSIEKIIQLLDFQRHTQKEIRFFSSGMKQRLRLALAIFSDTPVLLLDEPTTNLDEQGIAWYQAMVEQFGQNRTVIIASNDSLDVAFCEKSVQMLDFKK
jgi:ABC-type multidrug transport system ATPase subunit